MENRDIVKVLSILTPDAQFVLIGDNYADIEWLSETISKPTKAQVEQKHAEIVNNMEAELTQKAADKTALLARLGISAEEAKLLLE
jgi:hypothetical protein